MKSSTKSKPAVEFKGYETPALRAILRDDSAPALQETLQQMLAQQPDFFGWQPVAIDLSRLQVPAESLAWAEILAAFRAAQLHPVGLVGDSEALRHIAQSYQLGLLELPSGMPAAGASAAREGPANAAPVASAADQAARHAEAVEAARAGQASEPSAVAAVQSFADTMVIDRAIRSGQQIYARDRDLIVMGVVSPGAEVIADGNIHVYGSLGGRAIAGARGHRAARIFTLDLRAEIVAVAGLYKTFEDGVPEAFRGKPVQVALASVDSDALEIRPI